MKRRFTRLPIVQFSLVAVSVLIGFALAPVAAQSAAGLDGQVAIRSDGAVYLIASGVRRWVATVVISDEELNAYPEAEPIYAALAPFGGGSAASSGSTAAAKPAAAPPAASSPAPASAATPAATPASATGAPSGSQTSPVGGACPSTHQVKGATTGGEKLYYEPDRPEYPNITPETCFVAGGYARDAGYKNSKK